MPANQHEVELTVKIPANTWETLVEYSRALKHDTPARTVLLMLYPTLETFLHGKSLGVEVGAKVASDSITRVLDTVLPATKQQ